MDKLQKLEEKFLLGEKTQKNLKKKKKEKIYELLLIKFFKKSL